MTTDYTIDYSLIKSNVSMIFEQLPKEGLILENITSVDIEGDKEKISGQSKGNWTIEGILLTKVNITLTQSKATQEIDISNVLITYSIGERELQWTSKETAIGSLVFSCKELETNPLKKEEITSGIFLNQLDLIRELGKFDSFECELHLMGFSRLELSYLWKSKSTVNLHFGNGLIDIDQFTLNGTIGYNIKQKDDNIADTWQKLIFKSNLKFAGIETMLELDWDESSEYRVTIQPTGKNIFTEFSSLLKELNLGSFEKMAEEFNKELPFLKEIVIEKIVGNFKKGSFEVNQLSFFGIINCFEAQFEIEIIHSKKNGFSINLRLFHGELIAFNTLIGDLFEQKIHLPVNPKIVKMSVQTSFKPLRYSFSTRLLDVWSFSLGAESFAIKRMTFYVEKVNESLFDFKLRGLFLFNNIDFEVVAEKEHTSSDQGWYLETEIAQSTEIHLKDLITALGRLFHFTVPKHIPDFTVHNINLSFHTHTHDFHLELGISLQKPGIGPFDEGEVDIVIDLTKNDKGTHDFLMNLDGYIKVAGTEFNAKAHNIGNKDWSIDLFWDKGTNEDLSLLELGKIFDKDFNPDKNKDIQEVKHLLTLNHAEVHYSHGYEVEGDKEAKPTTFLIDARLGKDNGDTVEGLLAGINPNESGKGWDFLIGVGYNDHAEIPVVGEKIPSEFTLENAWCLINTSTLEADCWPPLPETFPETLTKQTAQKGIMVMAKMDLTQEKHGIDGLEHITECLPHSTITLLAGLNDDGLLIEAMLDGDVTIPTGQGHHITIENVAIIFKIGKELSASLALKGDFQLELDNNPQQLKVELEVDEYGIVLLATDKMENNGWKPFGLEAIYIDELGFELGIDFEPPGARIGFEGKMHFEGQDKNAELLAIVMEFVGPIPNPEYLALEIKELSLDGLLELFPGSSKHGHNHIKGNLAKVDDFALTWCEKPVVLPDGKTGKIGFSCHGAVEIFNWGAYVALEVHPKTGIQGFGELSPVKIGPLQITGKGKGISITQNCVEGKWINVSNVQINPDKEDKPKLLSTKNTFPSRQHQIVAPGGAVIQFNSAASPYLNFSAELDFFDLKLAEVDIEIAKDKLIFDVFLQIPLIASFKVHCNIQQGDNPEFDIYGNFFLGIHIKFDIPLLLATIHVDFQFGLQASIEIKKEDNHFFIELKGGINFMGHIVQLADLKIDGIPDSLAKLPDWIIRYIETGHAPKFKKHIADGSGENSDDAYTREKKDLATEMLVKTREWAAYVHKDIQTLKVEKRFSVSEINALVDKIRDDIKNITEKDTNKKFETNITMSAKQEIAHLDDIEKSINEKVTDANEQRKNEIEKMKWETQWMKDESEKGDKSDTLRYSIKEVWDAKEEDLIAVERSLMQLQEDFANNTATEEKLLEAENDRDGVLREIKDKVNELIAEIPEKNKYPKCAVDHHYFMIEQARKSHWLENEILTLGKNHHRAILSEVMIPTHFLKKIKPSRTK